jgi:hypothetical protein
MPQIKSRHQKLADYAKNNLTNIDVEVVLALFDPDVHDRELLAELALQARSNASVRGTPPKWIQLYKNFEDAAKNLADYIALMEVEIEE